MDGWQQLIFLLEGVPLTLSISIFSFLIGIAVGLPLAFIRVYEKEIGFVVDAYEKIWRGIPEIVLLLLIYFGLGPYFPWAVPGILSVPTTEDIHLNAASYIILILTSILGYIGTLAWCLFADQK